MALSVSPAANTRKTGFEKAERQKGTTDQFITDSIAAPES